MPFSWMITGDVHCVRLGLECVRALSVIENVVGRSRSTTPISRDSFPCLGDLRKVPSVVSLHPWLP
jgi:hypothetical protein